MKWGKEKFIEYIEDWNNANFKAPEFMKTFLKSFNKIEVERFPREMLWLESGICEEKTKAKRWWKRYDCDCEWD